MFPYEDIHPDIARAACDALQFDFYRLVDPRDHRVFSYDRRTEKLVSGDEPCFRIWKQGSPCTNCTSRSCLALRMPMFKIEYLEGRVMLVVCLPSRVEGVDLSLELIKDVTESLLVADTDVRDNIEITHMITKFNELAVRDGFTKLFNKTYINNELEGLIQAAKDDPEREPAAVVVLDIDDLKLINDTYGHVAGDDTLVYFANRLRSLARAIGGWVGRFGGDEFVLCVPDGLDDAGMERLFAEIDAIEEHVFESESAPFSLTASCGACYVRPDDTVRTLLDRADEAMYRAKEVGHRLAVR